MQKNARMPQRAAAAIAGDFLAVNMDDFKGFNFAHNVSLALKALFDKDKLRLGAF